MLPAEIQRLMPMWLRVEDLVSLGNHGGFSGALIFLVRGAIPYCVRGWPLGALEQRIRNVHQHLIILSRGGIDFVPTPLAWRDGTTVARDEERFWELTPWLPGRADFREDPSRTRLAAATIALARIHRAWSQAEDLMFVSSHAVEAEDERDTQATSAIIPISELPPAIIKRRTLAHRLADQVLPQLHTIIPTGRVDYTSADHSTIALDVELASSMLTMSTRLLPAITAELDAWNHPLRCQACIRDIWHDHILFTGDQVTGIVDFDALARDTIATDLARMLGSIVPDNLAERRFALEQYAAHMPFTDHEHQAMDVIDRANVVLGALQWLSWMYIEGRRFEDLAQVRLRWQEIDRRLRAMAIGT